MKPDPYAIIRTPVITEKTTTLNDAENKAVFKVDIRANKHEIKNAVQQIYNVQVEKVRTMRMRGKVRTLGRYSGRRPNWKKAIVTLKKGHSIDFLEGV